MSQSTGSVPPDTDLIAMTDPASNVGVFYTVAELRAAMSPVGYLTPADQVLTTAVQAAQATASAAIPSSTLGQPLGPVQSDVNNLVPLANLPASVLGSSHFLGTWNALLNIPLIVSGVAPAVSAPVGGYYIVSVSGTPLIDGNSVWNAGDWIIWERLEVERYHRTGQSGFQCGRFAGRGDHRAAGQRAGREHRPERRRRPAERGAGNHRQYRRGGQ